MSNRLMIMRKPFIFLFVSLLITFVADYFFRESVLRSMATFLIREDSLQTADALFVLSGGGYDRGNEAVNIYHQGYVKSIVCTGGNPVYEFRVFNIDTLESDMTVANLKRQQIPDSAIVVLREGTSTNEEAAIIFNYCKQHQLKRIMVLSSKIHSRRVKKVFAKQFNSEPVEIIVRGAFSSRYDEMLWWQSEDGLIALNNEWLKTVYYLLKY